VPRSNDRLEKGGERPNDKRLKLGSKSGGEPKPKGGPGGGEETKKRVRAMERGRKKDKRKVFLFKGETDEERQTKE